MKRGLEHADGYQNPSKRLKVTPVIFFWKLPHSATEQKVLDFCHPFGDIKESLFFPKKSQALVEMANIEFARNLVERYQKTQPKIDGSAIQLEFSRNKDHITPKYDSRAGYESSGFQEWGSCHVIVAKSDGIDRSTSQEDLINLMGESRLDPQDYQMTKTLTIFKKRIAFIEFLSPEGANVVWKALKELKVYLNNYPVRFMKGERDFLEGGDEVKEREFLQPPRRHRVRPSPARHLDDFPPDVPRDVIEDARSIGIPLDALIMVPCVKTRDGPMLFDEYYAKKLRSLDRRRGYDDARDMPRRGERFSPQRFAPAGGPDRVVMITGIENALCDCDKLQSLCGAFGDVRKTKLSFKNRDVGFVEMVESEGARMAVQHLKGLQIYERELDVKVSRMRELQGRPNEMNENKEILTKDYHNSQRNRYSDRNLRRNINPPGVILHISNVNLKAVNELGKEDLENELSSRFGDKEVSFLPNLDTQLFCFAGSVEESVRILVEFHLEDFHGRPLRISFSGRETMPKREE